MAASLAARPASVNPCGIRAQGGGLVARHTAPVASRVVVFSTAACTYCEHAKNLLRKRGVPFEDVDLGADPELRAQLTELTGLESYPQILVDGETLGGLNELRAAEKSGVMAGWTAPG
jgi:glutaredoxin 3